MSSFMLSGIDSDKTSRIVQGIRRTGIRRFAVSSFVPVDDGWQELPSGKGDKGSHTTGA